MLVVIFSILLLYCSPKKNKMKKIVILFTVLLALTFCKGPKAGPLAKESFDQPAKTEPANPHQSPGPAQPARVNVKITPCEDCIKITDLLENKKSYNGKVIKVTGQVVKYNPGIMGKNWVHIQDGTDYEGIYDLTVTTQQPAKVGDIMTFEGTISLDKDFGYGYFYPVIMEDAKSGNQGI
jgi:hypothetical protein